jgi:hypothetical protein
MDLEQGVAFALGESIRYESEMRPRQEPERSVRSGPFGKVAGMTVVVRRHFAMAEKAPIPTTPRLGHSTTGTFPLRAVGSITWLRLPTMGG